jgi:hypothetical protein
MPARRAFVVLWEFQVKPEAIPTFEKIYGPDGAWAELFRQIPDYLGTELIRDLDHPRPLPDTRPLDIP